MSAVAPDSWNKMRVTYAKAEFSERTIAEESLHYLQILKCEDHTTNYKLSNNELREGATLGTQWARILEKKAQEMENVPLSINWYCLLSV